MYFLTRYSFVRKRKHLSLTLQLLRMSKDAIHKQWVQNDAICKSWTQR